MENIKFLRVKNWNKNCSDGAVFPEEDSPPTSMLRTFYRGADVAHLSRVLQGPFVRPKPEGAEDDWRAERVAGVSKNTAEAAAGADCCTSADPHTLSPHSGNC